MTGQLSLTDRKGGKIKISSRRMVSSRGLGDRKTTSAGKDEGPDTTKHGQEARENVVLSEKFADTAVEGASPGPARGSD